MENNTDSDYCLKNAYRALSELISVWPKDGLKTKIAFYDYFKGAYCYAVFSEQQGFWQIRVYPQEEAFVNYLEYEKKAENKFYQQSALIFQEYLAVYFLEETALSDNFRRLYLAEAPIMDGRVAVFCARRPGEAERLLTDNDSLRCLSLIFEKTRELLLRDSWSKMSLKASEDTIMLLDYQETEGWQKKYLPICSIYAKLPPSEYDNPFLLRQIAQKKPDAEIYELSWFYIPIEQYTAQGSCYPLYANLVALSDGKVIFSTLVRSKEESRKKVLDNLAQNLAARSLKPGYIVTADYSLWRQIESFCAKSKIELRYIEQGIVKERIMEGFKLMYAEKEEPMIEKTDKEKIIFLENYQKEKYLKE